jgi:protein-tyrosine-phosphatase
MTAEPARPLRLLFLCTGNSARSQMAEAILNLKGKGKFEAHSAGSHPAPRVNPLAIDALRRAGIEWRGHEPSGLDGLDREHWDLVITVCDRAKESCPIFPGQPMLAHWGMDDPAAATGSDEAKRRAFAHARDLIARRIDLLVQLPMSKLEKMAAEQRVRAIGAAG